MAGIAGMVVAAVVALASALVVEIALRVDY